jgi:hypothetical protein
MHIRLYKYEHPDLRVRNAITSKKHHRQKDWSYNLKSIKYYKYFNYKKTYMQDNETSILCP